ncbi:IS1380 family transposase [Akkermansiaceae bacterium]|nr:IS1380 family transposase [Akkermansiaceae bacterium]
MTDCSPTQLEFSSCQGRKVQADFKGGNVSSDGGVLLLREVDKKLNLLSRAAKLFKDDRDQHKVVHTQDSQLKQRVFALAQGHEDLNDHDHLRHDILLQTVAQKASALASAPTLCRMEQRADRHSAMRLTHLLIDLFVESHTAPPSELILDFDATDDLIHGRQQGSAYNHYYRGYCFLPLYVFCGSHPLCALLRPSNTDGARGAWAILKILVKRLRKAWPQVKIIFRADSGFCRWRMLRWCENNNVHYLVGLARNNRVTGLLQPTLDQAEISFQSSGKKQRLFTWLHYQAGTWDRARFVIGKAEHTAKGSNPRYLVTNLRGDARALYDKVYCPRGDMENRIKEQQLDLFADRTSCHRWWPNQHRLIMSTLAYVLMDGLRRLGLKGTDWMRKQSGTIRAQLLKIGAVVIRNTRRIKVHLSSSHPARDIFEAVHRKLQLVG